MKINRCQWLGHRWVRRFKRGDVDRFVVLEVCAVCGNQRNVRAA